MAFRVGQKVVCVDDAGFAEMKALGFSHRYPVKDGIYTIRHILIDAEGDECLRVCEIKNRLGQSLRTGERAEPFFLTRRFRPLVDPKTDTGMAILEQIRRDVSNKILRPIFEDEQV